MSGGRLTAGGVRKMSHFFFSQEYVYGGSEVTGGNIYAVTQAAPEMKTIGVSDDGSACFLPQQPDE